MYREKKKLFNFGPDDSETTAKLGRRVRKTSKGLAASAKNAVKHGAYSGVAVLPFEDPAEYRRHVRAYLAEYCRAPRERRYSRNCD